ncbi:MAG: amidohydrolase family protein [Pseudoxanthomonas sp.]
MSDVQDLEITDCHHHLWDLQVNYYPWLTDRITQRVCGEYSAIRKNYLIEDFLRDMQGLNVVRSVHVQAEHDHTDPVRETRWLQSVADNPVSRGFPHGIVVYADMTALNVELILDQHCMNANVRGVRQMMHEVLLEKSSAPVTHLDDANWRSNLSLLGKHGLSFDLQVYHTQIRSAYQAVKSCPNVQFVLCHMGQPAQRDAPYLAAWQAGLRLMASLPNVAIKISGVGMFERAWSVESLRPLVLGVIEAFGVQRCLFASNFPVDGMMNSYRRLWDAYSQVTEDFTADERRQLFSENARRIYRV